MPRRKHRRVRPHWEGCGCPSGSEFVDFQSAPPYARKFLCIAPTPNGPRFVRADCSSGHQRSASRGERVPKAMRRKALPVAMREQMPLVFTEDFPAPNRQQVELPLGPKPKKKRKKPIDWSRCKCPPNAEVRTNAKGVKYCWGKTGGGGRAFVTPLCPPDK